MSSIQCTKITAEISTKDSQPHIYLCTYASAQKVKKSVKQHADFVILDECHNSWSATRKYLNKLEIPVLKLTATVHKNDKENIVYSYSYAKANRKEELQNYVVRAPTMTNIRDKKKGERFIHLMDHILSKCAAAKKTRLVVFNRTIRDDVKSADKFSSSSEFHHCKDYLVNKFNCKMDILSNQSAAQK
jgi:superfamily II DNA or RNA helicase